MQTLLVRLFEKPLVSLTDESDTLARLGFVAVGMPVLSLGSVGSVTGAGSPPVFVSPAISD